MQITSSSPNSRGLNRVFIVDGGRIPFQRSGTTYRHRNPYQLSKKAISSLLHRQPELKDRIEFITLGTVIQDVNTSNLAREAALGAGLSPSIPAITETMACISSNAAINRIADAIALGRIDVGLAAGAESMSDIPIRLSKRLRQALLNSRSAKSFPQLLGHFSSIRPRDLKPDIPSISEFSTGETMGKSCDRMVMRYGVNRQEQDQFALRSHDLAFQAHQNGRYTDELLDASDEPDFQSITDENGIRGNSTLEKLSKLKPAFESSYGTVTAGNASFLTDGASAMILASEKGLTNAGISPLAEIVGSLFTAKDPETDLLIGPALAIPRLLRSLGLTLQNIDVIEIHEAFAGQVLSLLNALNSQVFFRNHLPDHSPIGELDMTKLNLWGGSLAIGHPFGATGIRLVSTAARRLHHENGELALIASCAAGGQAHAMVIRRVDKVSELSRKRGGVS